MSVILIKCKYTQLFSSKSDEFLSDQTLTVIFREIAAVSDQSGDFLSFADASYSQNSPLRKALADRLGRTVCVEEQQPLLCECQIIIL